ncbi:MAG: trigger factor [bacterium]
MNNMSTTIEKLPRKTYKLTITVDKTAVDTAFEHTLKHFAEHVKVEGFRQGKTPINIVKDKVDKSKLNGEVINNLVPEHYTNALKEYKLNPIINPKIEITQFEEGKDLIFTATVVEKPEIVLGDYKTVLKTLKTDNKEKPALDIILNKIIEVSKIEIPQTLIDEEVTNMFSNLIDQTARLGITVEDYLKTNNKTVETLKVEYAKTAEYNLKTDFLLNEIAGIEKIEVSEEDVQKTIDAAPDEKTKAALSNDNQKWYIKSVLKKNKVVQYLINFTFEKEKK